MEIAWIKKAEFGGRRLRYGTLEEEPAAGTLARAAEEVKLKRAGDEVCDKTSEDWV